MGDELQTNTTNVTSPPSLRSAARCVLLLLLLLAAVAPPRAVAGSLPADELTADVRVFSVNQQDLDGDGAPDLTVIDCAIVTPYDNVWVFDGGRNMRTSGKWEEATDFEDDTWVFDIGGAGTTNRATLIIAFATSGDDTVARIYDGSVTSGVVRYEVQGRDLQVLEPNYPSMVIRAKGGWLSADGTLNYNLIWQFDGPAANREYAKTYPSAFVLDGNPDAEGEVRDADYDGIPEYLWTNLLALVPPSERIPRAGIQVNSGQRRPSALKGVVFWPLLNRPEDPQGKNYFDTPLFLGFDWQNGLIKSFSFLGYPVEDGYHVNTLTPLKPRIVNVLNFENPMAYYDLAGDRDGRPELFIRMAYTPSHDPYFVTGGPTRSPIEMVQYSWNQKDHKELRWDFKVDLAGRNALGRIVRLGDFLIEQVPHADLPRWVMTNPWVFATFVAYESGDGYLSSEGIYDWSTLEGVQRYEGIYAGSTLTGVGDYTSSNIDSIPNSERIQRDYVGGASSKSPEALYQSILAGFRGEYADLNGPIELYFSPIDARLHLVGATRGVYNIGNRRRVEYRNLDRDAYIDSWQFYEGSRQIAQLLYSRDYLIASGDDLVQLQPARVPAEHFRVQPPTNRDEWVRLGQQLDAHKRDFALNDFRAMLQQFDGPRIEIENAELHDYRPLNEGGFRFVLDLKPAFRVRGTDLLGVSGLRTGSFAVTYDGTFTVAPLTPPVLSASLTSAPLRQLEPSTIRVVLRNDGLQDVPSATLELWAEPPSGQPMRIAEQEVAFLAQTSSTVTVEWAPTRAGQWILTPQIREPDGRRVAFDPSPVSILAATPDAPATLIGASTSLRALPFAALALISFGSIAASAMWQQRKPSGTEQTDVAG